MSLRSKSLGSLLIAVFAICVLFGLGLTQTRAFAANAGELVTVPDESEDVPVRQLGEDKAAIIGVMHQNSSATVVEQLNGWTHVTSGEIDGWVKDGHLLFGQNALNHLAALNGDVTVAEASDGSQFGEDPFVAAPAEEVAEDGTPDGDAAVEDPNAFVPTPLPLNEEEIQLLGALIQTEAGNQPYEGMLGVAAVVCNRVKSSRFPSCVNDVIRAPGQFTPVRSGKVDALVASGNIKDSCIQAAREAAAGGTSVGMALYFRRAGNKEGQIIGGHVFY